MRLRTRPPLLTYLVLTVGFNISGSDQACCVCARPSRVPVGVRVLSVSSMRADRLNIPPNGC